MVHTTFKGIEAVIFDLGGTLVKLPVPLYEYHRRFLQEVCGDEFHVSDETLAAAHDVANGVIGDYFLQLNVKAEYSLSSADWVRFNYALLKELGVSENLEERAKQYQRLWNDLLSSNPDVLIKGAKEVLEKLSNCGYKLAVATNWEDPSEGLKNLDIFSFFQSIQWTLIKGYCKSSPYMLIMNAYNLQVNPLKCAFIGDNVSLDVEAARRAGMVPILLTPKKYEDVQIHIISDITELLYILK
jgi:FMN phosphatase YigB (HAD superfamily)